jgi:hypothetical protein
MNAECPAAFPVCRAGAAGGATTCRVALDAGAPPGDAGPASDAAPAVDASGVIDAAGQ